MTITNDIRYIGVNDHDIDLFEGQYIVPEGMAYNSYVIIDEKIAVMDTVSADFGEEWLANLENVLGGRKPDYLIIHHMEPDHSGSILRLAERYPEMQLAHSRIFPKNLLPRPSPLLAPFTRPAISTISQVAGTMRPG